MVTWMLTKLFSQSLLILVIYSLLYLLTYLKGKKGPPSLFTGERLESRTLSRDSSPSLGKHTQGSVHHCGCRQGFHCCTRRAWVSLSTVAVLFHPTAKSWGKGGEQKRKEREACPHHWAVSALRGQRTKVPEEQGSDVGRLC